ncbi:hypothetical protein Lsai_2141 [Legionella sainthelensi]|uniref:Uncharacterized protein n=1 Tax=Legionella sainthelensi TaxID=28087 RepID=A0A0W0YGP5_9GAMM|nr:hypothetical protein Lsai_2141 [Legionella sainthelensi]VEH28817.1 Uncharacterised protein [Legionella sainthelensi]
MTNRYQSPYDLPNSYECQPETHVEKAKESYGKMVQGLGYAAVSPVIAAAMVQQSLGMEDFPLI